MERTVEKRLAGVRTEGHFITPGQNGHVNEARKVKTLTGLNPVSLCSDCRWPNVCMGDAACWDDERRVAAEVIRYRKREKRGQLTGTVADVAPVSQATGRAHAVGSDPCAPLRPDRRPRLVAGAGRRRAAGGG